MINTNQINNWKQIDWPKAERFVFRIQQRIFKSTFVGDHKNTHTLQRLLICSFFAKLLAVKLATEKAKGCHTAGSDGIKSISNKQKLDMAKRLGITQKPGVARRTHIANGNKKTRPLTIHNLEDRASQHLINLALAPQVEFYLSKNQFGFRKGRSQHDPLVLIRTIIQQSDHWVLSLDIEKCFDNIDHAAILRSLNCHGPIKQAITRILKSKVQIPDKNSIERILTGTPQGSPLSPTLANLALSGLEQAVHKAWQPGSVINGTKVGKAPHVLLYADDAVIIHKRKDVLEASIPVIQEWLALYGLNLNQDKTQLSNTLKASGNPPGFQFMGFYIQQHKQGRHNGNPNLKNLFTRMVPSKDAEKRLRLKIKEELTKRRPNKRRKAEYAHKVKKGRPTREELLIIELNQILRGWGNYFSRGNSKRAFSRMDNDVFRMTWKWLRQAYKGRPVKWIIDRFWMKPRNGKDIWQFNVPSAGKKETRDLLLLRDIHIKKHIMVPREKSYYDGDWAYWSSRLGDYPTIPKVVARKMKRQSGYCPICNNKIRQGHQFTLQTLLVEEKRIKYVTHRGCT